MPKHPLNPEHPEWPNVERAWRVYHDECGGKNGAVRAAADAVGRPWATVKRWVEVYQQYASQDPAIQDSMMRVGTEMIPRLAWAKTKTNKDGTQRTDYSVMLKPDPLPDDTLRRIREAFEGMEPAEPLPQVDHVMDDLCAIWPITDMHIGMKAWHEETGGPDYDIKHAAQDLYHGTESVLHDMPFVDTAVIILNGDTLHADDDRAETPKSRHPLDVDGRQMKVSREAVKMICFLIERVGSKCRNMLIRVMRGNHDPNAHKMLYWALWGRYGGDPKVQVESPDLDLWMWQWGRCALFAHHGDKGKPEELALGLADKCPFWSEAPHRHAYTGHRHKSEKKRIGGLFWHSLEPFTPADEYGSWFVNRREMVVDIYHRAKGFRMRISDPLERDHIQKEAAS